MALSTDWLPMHTLHRYFPGIAALALFLTLLLAQSARAQTGPDLLVKPWPDKGQVADGYADAYFFDAGHAKDTGDSFRLSDYESVGRFRILPGNEISPRIGYNFLYLDNHTTSGRLPRQLSDDSVAIGTGIAKWGDGWVAGITLGVGYAGSNAFAVGRGWYGKADIVVAREISDTDALGIILDYDGNRSYLPDTPLPGFGYSHRFDPKLQVVAGLPYSSLDWKPIDQVEITGEYQLFADIKLAGAYEFIPHFFAYGSLGFVRDSFHVDDQAKDRRLLFHQQRAEIGIRYVPIENLTAKIGLGYSWDGAYTSGWDFRKSTAVENISDTPYLRAGVEWKF
jgi:hypothetical protein